MDNSKDDLRREAKRQYVKRARAEWKKFKQEHPEKVRGVLETREAVREARRVAATKRAREEWLEERRVKMNAIALDLALAIQGCARFGSDADFEALGALVYRNRGAILAALKKAGWEFE